MGTKILTNLTRYNGRCHCGKISFSFESESIDKGVRCNCSICVRRGVVFTDKYVSSDKINLSPNDGDLSNYLWNDRVLNYYFCRKCGVTPYAGSQEFGYRVNLGCVEGVDPLSLPIRIIDGKTMPIAEDPGPHPAAT